MPEATAKQMREDRWVTGKRMAKLMGREQT